MTYASVLAGAIVGPRIGTIDGAPDGALVGIIAGIIDGAHVGALAGIIAGSNAPITIAASFGLAEKEDKKHYSTVALSPPAT